MGRYYSGNINGKFWPGIQHINCIEDLGGTVEAQESYEWQGCRCDYNSDEIEQRSLNNINCIKVANKVLSQTILDDDIVEKIMEHITYKSPCYCGVCFNNVEEHMEEADFSDIEEWYEDHIRENDYCDMCIERDNETFLNVMKEMKEEIEQWKNFDLNYNIVSSEYCDDVQFESLNFNQNILSLSQELLVANYTMGLLIQEFFRLNPDREECQFVGEL